VIARVLPPAGLLRPGDSVDLTVSVATARGEGPVVAPSFTVELTTIVANGQGREVLPPLALGVVALAPCGRNLFWNTTSCMVCTKDLQGDTEGVDCDREVGGGSLMTLPLKAGYWRSSNSSTHIRKCRVREEACLGGTNATDPDPDRHALDVYSNPNGYCTDLRWGPYCSLCVNGYGGGNADECEKCNSRRDAVDVFFSLMFVTMLVLLLCATMIHLWMPTSRKLAEQPRRGATMDYVVNV
ncbi:unnamed protein product, partial [Chrysoparadoxa australica]